jgi:hypothetical protein
MPKYYYQLRLHHKCPLFEAGTINDIVGEPLNQQAVQRNWCVPNRRDIGKKPS